MQLALYAPPSIDLLECIGRSAGIRTLMGSSSRRTGKAGSESEKAALLDDQNLHRVSCIGNASASGPTCAIRIVGLADLGSALLLGLA
jgi:hypothetical protein